MKSEAAILKTQLDSLNTVVTGAIINKNLPADSLSLLQDNLDFQQEVYKKYLEVLACLGSYQQQLSALLFPAAEDMSEPKENKSDKGEIIIAPGFRLSTINNPVWKQSPSFNYEVAWSYKHPRSWFYYSFGISFSRYTINPEKFYAGFKGSYQNINDSAVATTFKFGKSYVDVIKRFKLKGIGSYSREYGISAGLRANFTYEVKDEKLLLKDDIRLFRKRYLSIPVGIYYTYNNQFEIHLGYDIGITNQNATNVFSKWNDRSFYFLLGVRLDLNRYF